MVHKNIKFFFRHYFFDFLMASSFILRLFPNFRNSGSEETHRRIFHPRPIQCKLALLYDHYETVCVRVRYGRTCPLFFGHHILEKVSAPTIPIRFKLWDCLFVTFHAKKVPKFAEVVPCDTVLIIGRLSIACQERLCLPVFQFLYGAEHHNFAGKRSAGVSARDHKKLGIRKIDTYPLLWGSCEAVLMMHLLKRSFLRSCSTGAGKNLRQL